MSVRPLLGMGDPHLLQASTPVYFRFPELADLMEGMPDMGRSGFLDVLQQ